jgi:hypothetical protein
MTKRTRSGAVVKIALITLIGAGGILAETGAALASCDSWCQARHMCNAALNQKGLKGDQRKVEYQKCFANPQTYK